MKRKFVWLIFILTALFMIGCGDDGSSNESYNGPSSDNQTVNTPLLYGVGFNVPDKKANPVMMTSSLYKIDAGTGAAMLIGDTGYYITGIAYNSNTKKLYGIATNMMNVKPDVKDGGILVDIEGPSSSSQLIEINMSSGEGKLIGEIREQRYKEPVLVIDDEGGFSNPTFNSTGILHAWNESKGTVCTIDVEDGEADCGGKFKKEIIDENVVMAFDNKNLLYIMEGLKIFTMGKYDDEKEFEGMLPSNLLGVYNGDFHPLTGQFWGLYSQGVNKVEPDVKGGGDPEKEEIEGNLLIIDINEKVLMNALTVPDNINAITWVYNMF